EFLPAVHFPHGDSRPVVLAGLPEVDLVGARRDELAVGRDDRNGRAVVREAGLEEDFVLLDIPDADRAFAARRCPALGEYLAIVREGDGGLVVDGCGGESLEWLDLLDGLAAHRVAHGRDAGTAGHEALAVAGDHDVATHGHRVARTLVDRLTGGD